VLATIKRKNILISFFALLILVGVASELFAADSNLELLNLARKQYAQGQLDSAIATYDRISKSSDFWIESREEKAWAFIRKKDYDSALANLKSIFSPIFTSQIGPEAYVLSSFANYKMCDYKRAYNKILEFKKEMLPRVDALESLVKNPQNNISQNWLQKMKEGVVSSSDLGPDLAKMPRFFYRDTVIQNALRNNQSSKAFARLKTLAQEDLKEISKNLGKMRVIEVEIIQRSFDYDTKIASGDLKFEKVDTKNQMIFPDEKDSKEVWIDEIDKYQVRSRKCPTSGV